MERFLTKKQDKIILISVFFSLFCASHILSQSKNDLFQSVFGAVNDNKSILSIPVPLYLDNQYTSELLLYDDQASSKVMIEALKLLQLLKPRVEEETLSFLESRINKEKDTIELNSIDEAGLETYYNKRELALFIDIPSKLQIENHIDLKDNNSTFPGESLAPSPFSAYLNYFTSINLNISGSPSDRVISVPASLGLDSVLNYKSFVLESDILLTYKNTISVSDWNVQLIKDIREKNIRLKMGTISYPVTQLQGFIPLNGMVIGKNFSLDPEMNTQSLGKRSIVLQAPSEIEIMINGRSIRKMELPKGRYFLENLQLDTGANLIEIKIRELTGRVETLSFSQPFNISLLKKGLSDYSAAFGIYEEIMETPYFSGYYRYGLTDVLTLGANLQSDFSLFNSGFSLLLGTLAGNFSLESSLSYDNGFDWAASFYYRYTNSRFPYKNNWSFSASYRGENYNGLRLEKVKNSTPLRLSLYYGQILPGDINMGLSINRNFLSNWESGNTELALHLSRHFGKGMLMNLFMSEKINDAGENDFTAGLTITFNLPEKNETFTTSASWPGTVLDNNWQKSSPARVPGYSVNLGMSGLPSSVQNSPYGFSAGGEYRGYRFTSSLNHSSSILNANDQSLHNSSFNFSSALVYADSTFAISRPVYDSFAIISPKDSFEKYTIGINPEGKSYSAMLDGRGNAVLSDIRSYRNNQILFEAVDLPIGYDLGSSSFNFFPEYKSGTVIRAGSEAVVYAGGYLVDDFRTPYALSAVILKPEDSGNGEEKMFFTNREGYFELYGLYEGTWFIELPGDRKLNAKITIPSDVTGYYELGDIILKEEVKQ